MKYTILRADGSVRQSVNMVGEDDPEAMVALYLEDGETFVEGEVAVAALPIEQTEEVLAIDRMKALNVLRVERDRRLAACDWTQVPDAPLTSAQRTAWQVYRQVLRDLPETTTDPVNVAWPVAPSE